MKITFTKIIKINLLFLLFFINLSQNTHAFDEKNFCDEENLLPSLQVNEIESLVKADIPVTDLYLKLNKVGCLGIVVADYLEYVNSDFDEKLINKNIRKVTNYYYIGLQKEFVSKNKYKSNYYYGLIKNDKNISNFYSKNALVFSLVENIYHKNNNSMKATDATRLAFTISLRQLSYYSELNQVDKYINWLRFQSKTMFKNELDYLKNAQGKIFCSKLVTDQKCKDSIIAYFAENKKDFLSELNDFYCNIQIKINESYYLLSVCS
jgi:hypothetical protein